MSAVVGAILVGRKMEQDNAKQALNSKDKETMSIIKNYEAKAQELLQSQDEKIEAYKDKLVYDLKKCESRDYKESDAPIIFDSNQKPSVGLWQFQIETVILYYKKLYGKDITRKEAIEVSIDEEKAKQLAHDIIFLDDEKGVGNWYNCMTKLDLKTKVNVIKEIQ